MIFSIICLLTIFIAGMFRGIQDVLAFHFNKSYFDFPMFNAKYWSVNLSWINKHDTSIKELPFTYDCFFNKMIKFISNIITPTFSKTVICQLSDAWHFIKVLEYTFISLTICLIPMIKVDISNTVLVILLFWASAFSYVSGFNLTYNKLSNYRK